MSSEDSFLLNEDSYWHPYFGGLLIKSKVSEAFRLDLLERGEKAREEINKCNKTLAGAIKEEYRFKDVESWFMPQFIKTLNHYEHMFNQGWETTAPHIAKPFKVKKCELWINYQKCKEFNPRHRHTGHLSFVIYLDIPNKLIQENQKTSQEFANEGTGTIHFHHGEPLPFSISGFQEMPSTGDTFIFPAWMQHSVTPFFSDVERISVAGNITFETASWY